VPGKERNEYMDAVYLSALSVFAGAAIGGGTSLAASWLTQRAQFTSQRVMHDIAGREELYRDFIEEGSKLFADAYEHSEADTSKLVRLYALVSRMRVLSPAPVIDNADRVMRLIIDTYCAPNKTFRDLHELLEQNTLDPLRAFAEACRKEFDGL
jgi:hypothetical protein